MSVEKIVEIIGKGIAVRGNDIDTDRIIPARYLKEIAFGNMGKYAFYDERFDEKGIMKVHPFNDAKFEGASILVVNKNFGCGSSREHAPQSLMRFGIKAIIGESFGDIFAGNCTMIGLGTATLEREEIERIMDFIGKSADSNITVDIENREVIYGKVKLNIKINESIRKSFLEGTWDLTSLMLEAKIEIKKTMARLPYLNNFK